MRWRRSTSAAVSIAVAVAMLALQPAPEADAARYRQRTRRIAPGVWLTRIRDARGPNQLRLLRIDPSYAPEVEMALARRLHLGRVTTRRIARANGAIAAVNGDFFEPSGQMFHSFVEDGMLRQSHRQVGWMFGMTTAERPTIARPSLQITAAPMPVGTPWPIARWNIGSPGPGQVVSYTPVASGVANPPRNGCTARLLPATLPTWTASQDAVTRIFTVDAVRCSADPLAYGGGIVLGARGSGIGAERIRSLSLATPLRITWSLGMPGIAEGIGGMPLLVRDRQNVAPTMCWSAGFCGRNPRTGVGFTAGGQVLLLTVDGRQPGWSVGMTMAEFAQQFVRLGATWALNLDGGGSTTMVVRGDVKNRPSGGRLRRVGSAIVVRP